MWSNLWLQSTSAPPNAANRTPIHQCDWTFDSNKHQHPPMQQTGGCTIARPTPLQATSNTNCHPHSGTATNHHTTHHEHTYHAGTGFIQHDSRTTCANETRQNPNEFQALRKPHGTSYHCLHNNELQKVDLQSRDSRDMSNRFWQGF